MTALAFVSLALAALPALLYLRNARLYRPPPPAADDSPRVSVLVPARNEESSIRACVESVLANRGVELECVVLDDHSTDRTAEIVRELAAADPRLRLEHAPPLPHGWAGKQYACHTLASRARFRILAFLDADVRLAPDTLAQLVAFQRESGAALISGFPRQETGTLLEKLVIPLMHFLLLGFLPLGRMRKDVRPGLGAGCGQLFLTIREGYDKAGGHEAVKGSFHDGLMLPRAYRAAGLMTDVCDATDLATCRMYRSAGQVWNGLAKNAREGLAAPRLILFATLLLFGGQVLPFVLLPLAGGYWPVAASAGAFAYLPRLHAAYHFRQSWLGAALHPIGVVLLLAIQWYAALRALIGRPVGWKGRPLPTTRPGLPPGPPSS